MNLQVHIIVLPYKLGQFKEVLSILQDAVSEINAVHNPNGYSGSISWFDNELISRSKYIDCNATIGLSHLSREPA